MRRERRRSYKVAKTSGSGKNMKILSSGGIFFLVQQPQQYVEFVLSCVQLCGCHCIHPHAPSPFPTTGATFYSHNK